MKCPKCKGIGRVIRTSSSILSGDINKALPPAKFDICDICKGTGQVERSDGIDYNRKIAVPEHKAGQTGG